MGYADLLTKVAQTAAHDNFEKRNYYATEDYSTYLRVNELKKSLAFYKNGLENGNTRN